MGCRAAGPVASFLCLQGGCGKIIISSRHGVEYSYFAGEPASGKRQSQPARSGPENTSARWLPPTHAPLPPSPTLRPPPSPLSVSLDCLLSVRPCLCATDRQTGPHTPSLTHSLAHSHSPSFLLSFRPSPLAPVLLLVPRPDELGLLASHPPAPAGLRTTRLTHSLIRRAAALRRSGPVLSCLPPVRVSLNPRPEPLVGDCVESTWHTRCCTAPSLFARRLRTRRSSPRRQSRHSSFSPAGPPRLPRPRLLSKSKPTSRRPAPCGSPPSSLPGLSAASSTTHHRRRVPGPVVCLGQPIVLVTTLICLSITPSAAPRAVRDPASHPRGSLHGPTIAPTSHAPVTTTHEHHSCSWPELVVHCCSLRIPWPRCGHQPSARRRPSGLAEMPRNEALEPKLPNRRCEALPWPSSQRSRLWHLRRPGLDACRSRAPRLARRFNPPSSLPTLP